MVSPDGTGHKRSIQADKRPLDRRQTISVLDRLKREFAVVVARTRPENRSIVVDAAQEIHRRTSFVLTGSVPHQKQLIEAVARALWSEMCLRTDAPGNRDPGWDDVPEDWKIKTISAKSRRAFERRHPQITAVSSHILHARPSQS